MFSNIELHFHMCPVDDADVPIIEDSHLHIWFNPLQSYFINVFIGFYNEVFRQLTTQVVKHHAIFVNNKTLNQGVMNSVSELSLSTILNTRHNRKCALWINNTLKHHMCSFVSALVGMKAVMSFNNCCHMSTYLAWREVEKCCSKCLFWITLSYSGMLVPTRQSVRKLKNTHTMRNRRDIMMMTMAFNIDY